MRTRVSWLAIAGFVAALALIGSPAAGQIPFPYWSTMPEAIRIVGLNGGGTPDPSGEFEVVVRDRWNNPLPNISVIVDFSQCGDVRLCTDPHDPAAIVNCQTRTVRKDTGAGGRVTFRIVGHSTAVPGAPGSVGSCARFYFEGIGGRSARVSIYDLSGGDGLGSSDLSAWLADYFSANSPARADYDADGTVGAADLSRWLDVFFSGGSSNGCPTAHCP